MLGARHVASFCVLALVASVAAAGSSFTCNQPFMLPAEYTDERGSNFVMCFSDPRWNANRVVWYVQEDAGQFKALGAAARHGEEAAGEFHGHIVPLELPDATTGIYARPVSVRVHVSPDEETITMTPMEAQDSFAQTVQWRIRPRGFPPGTLKLPTTCGPYLRELDRADLLAPLTGAADQARVCMMERQTSEAHDKDNLRAWISWGVPAGGSQRTADPDVLNVPALDLDADIDAPSTTTRDSTHFFAVGFAGADRGVSIDICDRMTAARRCEMSRMVGHVRKTFVVGNTGSGHGPATPPPETRKEARDEMEEEIDGGQSLPTAEEWRNQPTPRRSGSSAREKVREAQKGPDQLPFDEHPRVAELETRMRRIETELRRQRPPPTQFPSAEDETELMRRHGVQCRHHVTKEPTLLADDRATEAATGRYRRITARLTTLEQRLKLAETRATTVQHHVDAFEAWLTAQQDALAARIRAFQSWTETPSGPQQWLQSVGKTLHSDVIEPHNQRERLRVERAIAKQPSTLPAWNERGVIDPIGPIIADLEAPIPVDTPSTRRVREDDSPPIIQAPPDSLPRKQNTPSDDEWRQQAADYLN